jgi:hypothetical protein
LSILIFLNELSCGTSEPTPSVDAAMERFVGLLRQIRQWRGDAALVTAVKREYLELAQGYYINQWIAARPRHHDLWRVIHSMQNRAPFSAVLPPGAQAGADYRWEGRFATALGAAHVMDGLLVSLLVDPAWDTSWVSATCEELTEDVGGEPDIDEYPVDVRHAAKPEHALSHEEWIKQAGLSDFRSGSEIWEARGDYYPNLQFLPRVGEQLDGLRPDWIIPVAHRLRTLDDAIAEWVPGNEPPWRTKVTPEAEQRKRLCMFVDLDGSERLFDWHARFPPGAGRIHLRLVPEEGKARIAHIGLKLGI